jgi:hypothetical protein
LHEEELNSQSPFLGCLSPSVVADSHFLNLGYAADPVAACLAPGTHRYLPLQILVASA